MNLDSSSPPPDLPQQLRDWYEQPLGQLLAATEQSALDEILPNLFGYHLLQVSFACHSLLSASRILHRAVMTVGPVRQPREVGLSGDPEALPISPDALDALILHHTLEFAEDPRKVLREAERTLVGEGHIVILGFNPRSVWGIRRLLRLRRNAVPWSARFLSVARVKDWLALLGFEVLSARQVFFRPPIQSERILNRLGILEKLGARWWPLRGGVYVIVARKKVWTLTPIKPRWRPRRRLVSGLAGPASRSRLG